MPGGSAFRYVILGSGRQGTAAAYDLARFGGAARVVMADGRTETARLAAARVDELVGREVAETSVASSATRTRCRASPATSRPSRPTVGVGEKDGRPARVTVDRYDVATGFTAMERLTGWHSSIVMVLQATGRIPPGAHRMECRPRK